MKEFVSQLAGGALRGKREQKKPATGSLVFYRPDGSEHAGQGTAQTLNPFPWSLHPQEKLRRRVFWISGRT
jgi:hypothetical protein